MDYLDIELNDGAVLRVPKTQEHMEKLDLGLYAPLLKNWVGANAKQTICKGCEEPGRKIIGRGLCMRCFKRRERGVPFPVEQDAQPSKEVNE